MVAQVLGEELISGHRLPSVSVNRIRTVAAGLICAALTTAAGCSGTAAEPTAAPAPAATTTAAAASPATASSSAAASSAPGVTTAADKTLCESVKKAGEQMKTQFIDVFKASEDATPAVYKKILNSLGNSLNAAVAGASDGPVVAAVRAFTAEMSKAASAADPAAAINTPDFEQTAKGITTACKPTGVNANF